MPTPRPLTAQMAASFVPRTADPWVALFEGPSPWSTKQEFLAHGLVDMDASPTRATELLAAYVRSLAGAKPEPAESPGSGAAPAEPSVPDLIEESAAGLALRLLACGALPFAPTPTSERTPDLLDRALRLGWGAVVLRLLGRVDLPSASHLQQRRSDMKCWGKALPWAHALALEGRVPELRAWLSLPGMDPNATDNSGRTPLFYARTSRVVEILCAAGTDPEHTADDGHTARSQWATPAAAHQSWAPWQPEDRAPLIEALRAAAGQPSAHARFTDLAHRWIKEGPVEEGGEKIQGVLEQGVLDHRIPTKNADGAVVKWGILGYIGINLEMATPGKREDVQCLDAWAEWGRTAPQPLLDHESVPGVPDGWVLLTSLYVSACRFSHGGLVKRAGLAATDVWAKRMLAGVAVGDQNRASRLGLLGAVGAALESSMNRVGPNPKRAHWESVLVDVASKGVPVGKGDGPASLPLRQELATKVLCERAFGMALSGEHAHALLEPLTQGAWAPAWGPAADVQWACLLDVYRFHARPTGMVGDTPDDPAVATLTAIMEKWLALNFVPRRFQGNGAMHGLRILAKNSPQIHSVLSRAQLEAALTEPTSEGAGKARPRL